MAKPPALTFTVDTKLFRELGELLVGRDSTALVELIKNSYDADATMVRVHATGLLDPKGGTIIVTDNGIGMDRRTFENGFLRIASRSKVGGDVRSPHFRRRYTGEKGVGRLAAHKLARKLQVTSRVWDRGARDALDSFRTITGVNATIDWDLVEEAETFDQISSTSAIKLEELSTIAPRDRAGTALTLTRLRRTWTEKDFKSFFEEVETLVPPPDLAQAIPTETVRAAHPIVTPLVRDQIQPGGFELHFSGDLRLPDAEGLTRRESADWLIEAVGSKERRQVQIAVVPTQRFLAKYPRAEGFSMTRNVDEAVAIDFQARVFQRGHRSWPPASRGVRVYYEGFRVLPYGDSANDWLGLDRDYRSRSARELGRLRQYQEHGWDLPEGDKGEGMVLQGTNAFFGAVFLTREGASDLRMLVNREGFLPSPKLDFIADMVRLGTDLHVRLQRAAAASKGPSPHSPKDVEAQAGAVAGDPNKAPTALVAEDIFRTAAATLQQARAQLAAGNVPSVSSSFDVIEERIRAATNLVDGIAGQATMFRVMASLGLEQAAFVHEVNGLALMAQSISRAMEGVADKLPPSNGRMLKPIIRNVKDLQERLKRNIVFLTDAAGIEGRRRRSRSSLRSAAEKVIGFLQSSAQKRGLSVEDEIDGTVMSPPMFPAELIAIFSNLLSNAIKFSDPGGRLRLEAGEAGIGGLWLTVQNTGDAVDLSSSEKWFEAFQSTTAEVDAHLGQGMGLGLTITRSMVAEYGGTIRFVPPSAGFATAVRVELPGR